MPLTQQQTMKKFCILIALLCWFSYSNAQEHLIFKGIPIDGDISAFSNSLRSKGFTPYDIYDDKDSKGFKGEFAGKECELIVFHSPRGLVFKVLVLQEYYTWSSLSSAFDDMVDLYTQKYGKPKSSYKRFIDPYYKGDGFELQALRNDKCVYFYVWDVPNGAIAVRLSSFGSSYYVTLTYEDSTNQALRDKEEEKKAFDDI